MVLVNIFEFAKAVDLLKTEEIEKLRDALTILQNWYPFYQTFKGCGLNSVSSLFSCELERRANE